MRATKQTKKRKPGRPAIPGKGKYTLSLTTKLVEGFWNTGGNNLSAFVDTALETRKATL